MPWQYFLDESADGAPAGWYDFAPAASAKLSATVTLHDGVPTPARVKVQSGAFRYRVDVAAGTQTNVTTRRKRPVRFIAPSTTAAASAAERAPKRCKTETTGDGTLDLPLDRLFDGACGPVWRARLTPLLQTLADAPAFLGPRRDAGVLPPLPLTFQALKPNAPADWRVVVLGKHPYPRAESATGIALFDARVKTWDSPRFGATPSLRCLLKAALIAARAASRAARAADLQTLLRERGVAAPADWFGSLLSQGVLLLNASLTVGGTDDRNDTLTAAAHARFWRPVVRAVLVAILEDKALLPVSDPRRHTLFLWWGADAARLRAAFADVFDAASDCVQHMVWCNPAAQGDAFCDGAPHLAEVNACLARMGQRPVDWLPRGDGAGNGDGEGDGVAKTEGGDEERADAAAVARCRAFVHDTSELHRLFLARLQAGLRRVDGLEPIRGILSGSREPFAVAAARAGVDGSVCSRLVRAAAAAAEAGEDGSALTVDERAAVALYTSSEVYARLNAALRAADRGAVAAFRPLLALLLRALTRLRALPLGTVVYRGVGVDVSAGYAVGSRVTWWGVSSCSVSRAVAHGFADGATLFYVRARAAVPVELVSLHAEERECVLLPGTSLRVADVSRDARCTRVTLHELPGERLVS